MTDVLSIGEQIKAARTEKGWTQTELAEKLGVSLGSVAGWEGGKTEPKRDRILSAITKVLGIEFPEEETTEVADADVESVEEAVKSSEKNVKKQAVELALVLAPFLSDPIRGKTVRLLNAAQENSITIRSLLKILEGNEDN
jgi:transcriptional regulator with XRE-family HTH domain